MTFCVTLRTDMFDPVAKNAQKLIGVQRVNISVKLRIIHALKCFNPYGAENLMYPDAITR